MLFSKLSFKAYTELHTVLKVYKDITGVYQRELRQSYAENFEKIDTAAKDIEDKLKAYVNEQLGVIENGSY